MQLTETSPAAAPLVADAGAIASWRALRDEVASATPERRRQALEASSTHIRQQVLQTIHAAGLGHIGGDFSVTDILVTLFDAVLRIDPAQPGWAGRDRFILSKGHCAAALYAVLASTGFFGEDRLAHFA